MKNFEDLLNKRKSGSLKIYLGYAAGVGKTYAMLQEAQRLKSQGFDVVVGYFEPHDRPETWLQVRGLEMIPRRFYVIGDRSYEEMDLTAILKRRPQIVLIDELAHSNVSGTKNEKRYQDILEILDNQINVISTLNVQHIESIADRISKTSRIEIRERVPDFLLQKAEQIVNVDVSICELRERMRQGKIYKQDKAELALAKFFSSSNLSILRETALKEAAGDQIRKINEQALLNEAAVKETHETVMVALSSDPTNAELLIRRGTRLANQLSSRCFVVYVQRKHEQATYIDSALQRRLQNNLKLAQTLGAEIVTLKGENVAELLVNFAQDTKVRHVVFGKSRLSPLRERLRGSVLLDFIHDSVGIDVHIVATPERER